MEKVYFYPSPQTDPGVLTTQLLALLKPGANWTKLTYRVVFFNCPPPKISKCETGKKNSE